MAKDRIKPMVITDTETGDVYTLEFSRETVRFAEGRGVNVDDVRGSPMTLIPEMFFCAFRKNHKKIARDKTDEILFKKLGGLTQAHFERLIQLFTEPMDAIIISAEDEDKAKNAKATVEL